MSLQENLQTQRRHDQRNAPSSICPETAELRLIVCLQNMKIAPKASFGDMYATADLPPVCVLLLGLRGLVLSSTDCGSCVLITVGCCEAFWMKHEHRGCGQ